MQRFTDIEQMRHVIKYVKNSAVWEAKEKFGEDFDGSQIVYPIMDFFGTVKLHGCNSGVIKNPEGFKFQSREQYITPERDNYGFARYMMEEVGEEALNELFDLIPHNPEDEVLIYGEWCGKGIQKKVAINQLPKQFVIFNVRVNGEYVSNFDLYESAKHNIYNILLAPSYSITIDFNDPEKVKEEVTRYVEEVDKICPWGKMFNVEGHGEGIVWVSVQDPLNSRLWFKTKGQSHKVSNQKETVQIDPEVLASIKEFVDYAVTDARLEQAIGVLKEEFGIPERCIDMVHFGKFLKWMSIDINKEEYDVLEASGLEWKQVVKTISNRCKEWYMEYIEQF